MIDYDQKQFATEEFVDVRQFLFRSLKIQRALDGFTCTPEAALLDLGCGEGAFARTLKKLFPEARISGCDISEAQLACARDLGGGVKYKTSTNVLPFENESFYAVFVLDVLEHVENPAQMLVEIIRVLRKGRLLLLHCLCEGQPLTLHWLCWKLNREANLKRDLVGHIQRFTHRSVLRLAAEQGFVCRRYRFFWILRRIAYWESRLLGRLSLEFGTDARFE